MAREFYTIQERDVGRPTIRWHGMTWLVDTHWGRTMPQDIGKRVFRTASPDVLQIESQEQLERRLARSDRVGS